MDEVNDNQINEPELQLDEALCNKHESIYSEIEVCYLASVLKEKIISNKINH